MIYTYNTESQTNDIIIEIILEALHQYDIQQSTYKEQLPMMPLMMDFLLKEVKFQSRCVIPSLLHPFAKLTNSILKGQRTSMLQNIIQLEGDMGPEEQLKKELW